MRIIKYSLSRYDKNLIQKYTGSLIGTDLVIPQDICEDMLATLKLGYERIPKYLASIKDIYKEAKDIYLKGKTNYEDSLQQLLEARRDVIDFAEGDLIRDLRKDTYMTFEEKVEVLLGSITAILKNMLDTKNSSGKTNPISGQGVPSSPYKTFGNILNTLAPPIQKNEKDEDEDEEEEEDDKSTGFSRGRGNKKGNSKKDRDKLLNIVKAIFNNNSLDLFSLAKNFSLMLKGKEESSYNEVNVGDSTHTRKMRQMKDIKFIDKKEWALDDEIVDAKLAKKSLRVNHPVEKAEKAQLVYVLADCSGSMVDHNREEFMKAVLISIGRNAVELGNKLWYRFFEGYCFDLCKLEGKKDWYAFLDKILNKKMGGGTDLHTALYTASEDIQKEEGIEDITEIVLITDGTENVNSEEIKERIKVPIHTVCLENIAGSVLANYKSSFTTLIVNKTGSIEESLKNGLDLLKVI